MKTKQHWLWWIGLGGIFLGMGLIVVRAKSDSPAARTSRDTGWVSSWFERNPWETPSLTCNFAFRKTLLPCSGTYWQSLLPCF
jgi:hypothetical protein